MTDQAYNIDLLATLGVRGAGKTRALLKPIETILSDAPRAAREHFLAATKEALRLDAAPVKPARKPLPPPPDGLRTPVARKPRKPTLASVAKQASKAEIEVARYEVKPDGTVVVVTGQGEQQQGNELDEWIAKHARAPERH